MCIRKENAKSLILIVIENLVKRATKLHEIVTCKQKWNYKLCSTESREEDYYFVIIDTHEK